MRSVTPTEARQNFAAVLADAATHPIRIQGRNADVVVVDATEWASIQETLALRAIPGMWDSIVDGKKTPRRDLIKLEDVDPDFAADLG